VKLLALVVVPVAVEILQANWELGTPFGRSDAIEKDELYSCRSVRLHDMQPPRVVKQLKLVVPASDRSNGLHGPRPLDAHHLKVSLTYVLVELEGQERQGQEKYK
jgi:hypothetical protein